MVKRPKIILWDIETSLIVATTFSLYPERIPHDGILQDWSIICGAWKQLGSKETKVATVKKYGDDKQVCKTLRDELADADLIIHHNGNRFDIKKLNARLIYHGLEPLPLIPTIDTLLEIKKVAAFTSNRLDYLGKHLFGQGKMHTDPGLWMEVLRGSTKAIKSMAAYNKVDVVRLEQLYMRIRPYIKRHPHIGVMNNQPKESCTKCGSINTKKAGVRISAAGTKRQEIQCQDCGSYHSVPIKN
jgi:RNase P subunit RPR2